MTFVISDDDEQSANDGVPADDTVRAGGNGAGGGLLSSGRNHNQRRIAGGGVQRQVNGDGSRSGSVASTQRRHAAFVAQIRRRNAQRRDAQRRDAQRRDAQRRDAQRRDAQRRDAVGGASHAVGRGNGGRKGHTDSCDYLAKKEAKLKEKIIRELLDMRKKGSKQKRKGKRPCDIDDGDGNSTINDDDSDDDISNEEDSSNETDDDTDDDTYVDDVDDAFPSDSSAGSSDESDSSDSSENEKDDESDLADLAVDTSDGQSSFDVDDDSADSGDGSNIIEEGLKGFVAGMGKKRGRGKKGGRHRRGENRPLKPLHSNQGQGKKGGRRRPGEKKHPNSPHSNHQPGKPGKVMASSKPEGAKVDRERKEQNATTKSQLQAKANNDMVHPTRKASAQKVNATGNTGISKKETEIVQHNAAVVQKPKKKRLPVRHGAGQKKLHKDPSMVDKSYGKCSRLLADSDSSTSFSELRKEISDATEEWHKLHNPRKSKKKQQSQPTTDTQQPNLIIDRGFNSLITEPVIDSDAASFDSSSYFSTSEHHTCSEDDSFVSGGEYDLLDNSDYGWMIPNEQCNVNDGNKEELYSATVLCAPYRKKMYRHSSNWCNPGCACYRWYVRVKFVICGKKKEVLCSAVTKLQDTVVGCRKRGSATTEYEMLEEQCEFLYRIKYGKDVNELECGFGIAIKMVFTMMRIFLGQSIVEEMGVPKVLRDILFANIPHLSDGIGVKFGATDDVNDECKLCGYDGMISAVAAEKCMRMWFPERNFSIYPCHDRNKSVRQIIYSTIADHDSITICQVVLNRLSPGYSEVLDADHIANVRRIRYTENPDCEGFGKDADDEKYKSTIIVRNKFRQDHSKGGSIYCASQCHAVTGEIIARPLWWLNLEKKLDEVCSWSYVKKMSSCFIVNQRYFLSTYQHWPGTFHEGFGVSATCLATRDKSGGSMAKVSEPSEEILDRSESEKRSDLVCAMELASAEAPGEETPLEKPGETAEEKQLEKEKLASGEETPMEKPGETAEEKQLEKEKLAPGEETPLGKPGETAEEKQLEKEKLAPGEETPMEKPGETAEEKQLEKEKLAPGEETPLGKPGETAEEKQLEKEKLAPGEETPMEKPGETAEEKQLEKEKLAPGEKSAPCDQMPLEKPNETVEEKSVTEKVDGTHSATEQISGTEPLVHLLVRPGTEKATGPEPLTAQPLARRYSDDESVQPDRPLKSIRVTLSPTYSFARENIPGENPLNFLF